MNEVNIYRRTIGVNFIEGGAEIVLWAPLVSRVDILINGSEIIPLEKAELGYWILRTSSLNPGDTYFFVLDDENQLPDPASLSQPYGVHRESEALDITDFSWGDSRWKNIPLDQYIIYELHVGTFTEAGTFTAIIEKLDYLIELGINALEIMPVAQFSGGRNWGYDGVFPFAVQNSYGGAAELQMLIDACHQKGLAVILDVVYNHIGPEGNHLANFAPFFTDKYHTPWGNSINFDDAWSDGVRQYFIENALMWFRDFHIDALRMDAVHAIKDFSPVHILKEIKEHVDQLSVETSRPYYLIVESDLNDTKFINPVDKGGLGMDAQWIDEFHHALRVSSGQPRTGYYSDFYGIASLAKSYKDAYVYDGAYSEHRKKRFGVKATKNPGQQFVVFSQNHDHIGNRMLGERTSGLVSFEMQKLLAGAVLVSPYLPLLFMGEEYGETNPFQYFVSHTDPELAEAVRKGRKKEFEAFHLEGEAPDPMSEDTFIHSRLNWELIKSEPNSTLFKYYKTLIRIRKKHNSLCALDRETISVTYEVDNQTIVINRWYHNERVICFLNFSASVTSAELSPYGLRWQKLIASSEEKWGGSQHLPNDLLESSRLELPPESFTLYINTHE